MPIEITGRAIRDQRANEMVRLAELEKKYRGASGIFAEQPFHVDHPDDPEITHCWSLPERVERRKTYGWVCVTAERAVLYGVRPDEIDRANNICRRHGLILMENNVEEAAGKNAHFVLQAYRQLDNMTDEFIAAAEGIRANPRDLSNDRDYAARLRPVGDPSPVQRKKTLGGRPGQREKRLNEQRMYQQLIRDAARQEQNSGLRAALKSELPKGEFNPDKLQPRVAEVDGVREIVISRDYTSIGDVPDFE